jgi:hypothetical protein
VIPNPLDPLERASSKQINPVIGIASF